MGGLKMFEQKADKKKTIEAFNKMKEEQKVQDEHIAKIYRYIRNLQDQIVKLQVDRVKRGKKK